MSHHKGATAPQTATSSRAWKPERVNNAARSFSTLQDAISHPQEDDQRRDKLQKLEKIARAPEKIRGAHRSTSTEYGRSPKILKNAARAASRLEART
jgi:hypothetical protein